MEDVVDSPHLGVNGPETERVANSNSPGPGLEGGGGGGGGGGEKGVLGDILA